MGRPLSYDLSIPRFILEDEPNCASTDPEIFYAEETYFPGTLKPVSAKYTNERQAKAICKECPLIMQCLEFALNNYEMGIWGGTTERDRQKLRSAMGRRAGSRTRSYEQMVK